MIEFKHSMMYGLSVLKLMLIRLKDAFLNIYTQQRKPCDVRENSRDGSQAK
jgi:hypothetical protein